MVLDSYLKLVLKRPGFVIIALGLLALLGLWFAQYFRLDASADSLVREGDEDLAYSRLISERYGTRDFVFITYDPEGVLFTADSLARLDSLRGELAALERVESVDSFFDVPLFEVAGTSLTEINADDLLTLESPGVDLAAARRDLSGSEAYRNVLLSEDGETTALIVNFAPNAQVSELLARRAELRDLRETAGLEPIQAAELRQVETAYDAASTRAQDLLHQDIGAIRGVLAGYRDGAEIAMGGVPMIADDLVSFVRNDLVSFGTAIVLFIILSLSYLFRKPRYVAVPLLCCSLTALTVVGLLGLFDWRVTVISSNFISLLLIITISLTVHLMVRYRELEREAPGEAHRERLARTLRGMTRPCAYTSLTTIVAFGSLVISDIPPIVDFGWMMVVGVLCAFCITFLLFPAVLALLRASPSRREPPAIDLTPQLARFTDRHGKSIVLAGAGLLLLSVAGMSRLQVENSFINYFGEETEIRQGMVAIDREMGGTTPLEVIVDMSPPNPFDATGAGAPPRDEFGYEDEFAYEEEFWDEEEGGNGEAYWFTSDKMAEIIAMHDWLDAMPETGKVLSLATVLGIAYELNDGEPLNSLELAVLYNRIPDQYKESLLRPYVSVEHDQVRFSIRVRESDPNLVRGRLLADIRNGLQDEFGLAPEQIQLTGMLVLYNNMLESLFDSQILTLALVLGVITLMFVVLFRSVKLALIGIIPNILAAATVLGIMGWLGIPLDMMTITIAAISVGIGVDNTIHYIHRFQSRFPEHGGDYRATMFYCHGSIGKAMYYTSFTIVVGFSILVLSNFIPTIYFGLLTSLAMIIALLGALTLLPQLLILFKPLGGGDVPLNRRAEEGA